MTNRRIRLACAAALALAAAMTLAASAAAHPIDCDDPSARLAGWPADWAAGDQCRVASGGPQTARTARTARPRISAAAMSGRLGQVGHNALLSRGMNAAIALNGD